MNTAPTLAPDAQPIDVIVDYISRGDTIAVELWKYCVAEWAAQYYAFDPENYFREQDQPIVEPENTGDDIEEEDPAFYPEEELSDIPLSPEVQEQLVLYAPLLVALKTFWGDLMIFTEDMPTVQQWPFLVESVERFIAFQPSDPDRLIRHVRRLHAARLEAEALKPVTPKLMPNTILHDIFNNKFD